MRWCVQRCKLSVSPCARAGEYRPDLAVNIVKDVVDKAAVGRVGVFGSTKARWVSVCVCGGRGESLGITEAGRGPGR